MRLCEQVDEWCVLRTTQNGECVCLFLVPRLTPVERPFAPVERGLSRCCAGCAVLRTLRAVFLLVWRLPCATRLTTSHPRLKAHENIDCSCHVITIHFFTHFQIYFFASTSNRV